MSTVYLSKAPLRVSFFGGGTDIPEWFNRYEGLTLSTTINYFTNVYFKPDKVFNDYKFNIFSNKIEKTNLIKKIENPLIRKIFQLNKIQNTTLFFDTDLPTRSGLASSSSFAYALLEVILKYKKIKFNKKEYSKYLINLERNLLKEKGGWQDQIAITYQGINKISYFKNDFKVKNIKLTEKNKKKLEDNLFLLWTGNQRFSSNIQLELIKKIEKKKASNHQVLNELVSLTKDASKLFLKENIDLKEFSYFLNKNNELKFKSNVKSYNSHILEIIDFCKKNGCLASKVLGAGSGGFILILINKDEKKNIAKISSKFKVYPFKFYL